MLTLNFDPFPIIKTERLLLRPLRREEDLHSLFFMRSDPAMTQYLSSTAQDKTLEDTVATMDRLLKGISNNEFILWAISLKEDEKIAGTICYWNIEPADDKAELGYALMLQHQGKGMMTEALQAVLSYGFGTLGIKTIEAFTNEQNKASINVLLRNGFSLHPQLEEKKASRPTITNPVVYLLEKTT